MTPDAEADRHALLALFDANDDLVAHVDAAGRLLALNAAGRRLCSIAPEEPVAGRPLRWVFTDVSARRLEEEALPTAQATGRWQGETTLRASGLQLPHVIQTVVPMRGADGALTFWTTARPDAQHRSTFEALRSSEARFRTLIEQLSVGVVVQGRRSEILLCNQAALELFGLTRDEMMQRTSYDPAWSIVREDGSLFPPEDRPVTRAAETLAPVRHVVMGIYRPRTQDRVWLLVDAEPALDPAGQLRHVVATLSDITEHKRLEDSLVQAQKLESLGRLAGGIAHDFNNLLTVIHASAELALAEAGTGEFPREDLGQIRQAARQAAGLTHQILTFARRQVVRPQRVELEPALRELGELLRKILGPRIAVSIQASPDLDVLIDPTQLEQVLVNLAVNARDAMPHGGAFTVRAQAAPRTADPDHVEIVVADTGSGIAPDLIAHIFDPFFTTKAVGQGTGLGLAIVHSIVHQFGGRITVDSAPAAGTAFHLVFPRAPAEVRAAEAAPSAQLTGTETLLVVDDEPLVLRLAARILATGGYRVIEASDGASALAALRANPAIDLVVTDIRMRPMTGPELAIAIAAARPELPVVFASGFSAEAAAAAAPPPDPRRPATRVLQKPYLREQLLRVVREVLDARAQTSA